MRELRKRGANVKIVMMDPRNEALVNARFERRRDRPPEIAFEDLARQLRELRALAAEEGFSGTFEVRTTEIMPFGFFLECGRDIVMGVLPPLSGYHNCPMIRVTSDSLLGQELKKNWPAYWSARSSREIEKLEEMPDVNEVWMARSNFSDLWTRTNYESAVRTNVGRGAKYTLVLPTRAKNDPNLQEFKRWFIKRRSAGKESSLKLFFSDSKIRQSMPREGVSDLVVLNPKSNRAELYIRIPGEQLWEKLEASEADNAIATFKRLVR
jgi:hypothetical protein